MLKCFRMPFKGLWICASTTLSSFLSNCLPNLPSEHSTWISHPGRIMWVNLQAFASNSSPWNVLPFSPSVPVYLLFPPANSPGNSYFTFEDTLTTKGSFLTLPCSVRLSPPSTLSPQQFMQISSSTLNFIHLFLRVSYACVCMSLNRVPLFGTPWTVTHPAPLSMEFSRQEYWNGLPFPSPGNLPSPGIEPRSLALQSRFFTI